MRIKINWYIVVLAGIVGLLFLTNYQSGTYLSGWDNLQTDLNPLLGVKRAFFSVWEEYQSFGLTAGMGHAADLLRAIYVLLLSLFIPQNLIRYIEHYSFVLIGALGIFKLLEQTELAGKNKGFALIGAAYYIFSFSTIQILFLPFETFSIFFAALPWQLWIFFKITSNADKSKNKRYYLQFFVINLLSTPYAVSQQLFLVYLLILALLCITRYVKNIPREKWISNHTVPHLKQYFMLFTVIIFINLFWLLPQLYFLKTNGSVVRESKINQLATEDIFYSNLEKGNIKDFVTLQGFLYDRMDKHNSPLFQVWKDYRNQFPSNMLVILTSIITFLGFFYKSKYRTYFFVLLSLVMISLLNNTFPFNLLNWFFRLNPLINQIFRSPFTKFAVPLSVVASYFFASGACYLYERLPKVNREKVSISVINFAAIFLLFILLCAYPSFSGYYTSPEMKVRIPDKYFSLMKYFETQDKNQRIALMPDYTFWGWFFHTWGYNGSGFLWYGIEQPIISRTFDVWSFQSESYFWEIKNAIEAEDIKKIDQVLQKYDISYIIFDQTLTPVVSTIKALQYDRLEKLLADDKNLSLVKSWDGLRLYKVQQHFPTKNYVSVAQNLPTIGPDVIVTQQDIAYQEKGVYQTKSDTQIYYPFLDLFSQTELPHKTWSITEYDTNFAISAIIPFNPTQYSVIKNDSIKPLVVFETENTVKTAISTLRTAFTNNLFAAAFPKNLVETVTPTATQVNNCGQGNSHNERVLGNTLKVQADNGFISCFSYNFPTLAQDQAYLVKIKNENLDGRRLFFYITDNTKKQSYLEKRLNLDTEYIVIHPRFEHGVGYTFNFWNTSYKGIPSINKLSELEVYTIPYDQLKTLTLLKKNTNTEPAQFESNFNSVKLSYYKYLYTNSSNDKKTVILNQSFSQGWHAYAINCYNKFFCFAGQTFPFIFGREIKDHVKINNWANGWNTNDKNIILLFWPQYLEYIGFLMLFIAFLYVLKRKNTDKLVQ